MIDDICGICREPLVIATSDNESDSGSNQTNTCTEIKTLDCNHMFHTVCIDSWTVSFPHCPFCRTPVQVNRPPLTTLSWFVYDDSEPNDTYITYIEIMRDIENLDSRIDLMVRTADLSERGIDLLLSDIGLVRQRAERVATRQTVNDLTGAHVSRSRMDELIRIIDGQAILVHALAYVVESPEDNSSESTDMYEDDGSPDAR